eukprot:Gb_14526 [translate_table: standard]
MNPCWYMKADEGKCTHSYALRNKWPSTFPEVLMRAKTHSLIIKVAYGTMERFLPYLGLRIIKLGSGKDISGLYSSHSIWKLAPSEYGLSIGRLKADIHVPISIQF